MIFFKFKAPKASTQRTLEYQPSEKDKSKIHLFVHCGNNTKDMRRIIWILFMIPGFLLAQEEKVTIKELDNSFFKKDKYWRGADGAATVELGSGKIL